MRDWPGTSARNSFRQALLDCERQVGLWSGLCSNIAAEIIAGAGFDWIVVDGEHAPNDIASLRHNFKRCVGALLSRFVVSRGMILL